MFKFNLIRLGLSLLGSCRSEYSFIYFVRLAFINANFLVSLALTFRDLVGLVLGFGGPDNGKITKEHSCLNFFISNS